MFLKFWGGHGPFAPPGYAYVYKYIFTPYIANLKCTASDRHREDSASKFRGGDFSNIWHSSLITGSLL